LKKFLMAAVVSVLAASAAMPANAITYLGNRTVGGATAQLSVTTDNTIGVLASANITDWSVRLTFGATTVDLLGPLSGNNSRLLLFGPLLSATATDLLFDFGGADALVFDNRNINGGDVYCLTGAAAATVSCNPRGGEVVQLYFGVTARETALSTGIQGLASVSGGVPEPSGWALMIAGFGLVGGAMRRKQRVKISYAA
jgi:hypothetical protein